MAKRDVCEGCGKPENPLPADFPVGLLTLADHAICFSPDMQRWWHTPCCPYHRGQHVPEEHLAEA